MAMILESVYDALREVGVSEESARKAAKDMAALPDVSEMKKDVSELKKDASALKADIAVLKWMCGFILAIVAAQFLFQIRTGIH